jgi:hypothetical protein
MNFKTLSEPEKKFYAELMFKHLSSPDELKDWIKAFLDMEYPNTITDRESTSNPVDAIWQVYESFLHNKGDTPGAIWLSARECLKTVSCAILEIILMLHFELEIAHAAAVESQSAVCLKYIQGYFFKLEPLLAAAGWTNSSQNKRTFEFLTPSGKKPFIKVVICTPKGMNSLHANILVVDELDLADRSALNEGKNIVGYSRKIHPFTLFLSTRKYSFGLMAEMITKADEMNYKLLRWNILDVTEVCGPERHLPLEEKTTMYVAKSLPLQQLNQEKYDFLTLPEQVKFDKLENVHAGCVKCSLLPICRMRLSQLPSSAKDGFYKPIKTVIQKFRENSPEIAESQLLCWKPGSQGLVYGRLNSNLDAESTNYISIKRALEGLLGIEVNYPTEQALFNELVRLGIPMYAGVDWGFTHDSVIIIAAMMPNGEVWIVDCWTSTGMEFSDVLDVAIKFRDKYPLNKWFCDQAEPSFLKSFNKNFMRAPVFTRDVSAGIESIRSKILTASGKRLFKIIKTENTMKVLTAMQKHKFKLDGQGNPTGQPDDEPGIADICDALRYLGQNLFPIKGPFRLKAVQSGVDERTPRQITPNMGSELHQEQMRDEINRHIQPGGQFTGTKGKKGSFFFDF